MSMKNIVRAWDVDNKAIHDALAESGRYDLLPKFTSLLWAVDAMAGLIDKGRENDLKVLKLMGVYHEEK